MTPAQRVLPRVVITEASFGNPDAVEIRNEEVTPIDLSGWTLEWFDTLPRSSGPLGITLAPGAYAIIAEQGSVIGDFVEAPGDAVFLPLFPSIPTSSQAFDVTLRDALSREVDRVRVSSTAGAANPNTVVGSFAGLATRVGNTGLGSVERLPGLDTDAGADWAEATVRTMGLANAATGPRGTDNRLGGALRINELDFDAQYVEIYNPSIVGRSIVDLTLLVIPAQGTAPRRFRVAGPGTPPLGGGGYLVVGIGATAPAELPQTASYRQLVPTSGPLNFGLTDAGATFALEDDLGRMLDEVRVSAVSSELVQNHPRLPGSPTAFRGAALRRPSGGLGRFPNGTDTGSGTDFRWLPLRSMGSANTTSFGGPGLGTSLDVRLDEGLGDGLSLIAARPGTPAGSRIELLLSTGHQGGMGPFFGLGGDALDTWLLLREVPAFRPAFDANAVARIRLAEGSLPPGLDFDVRVIAVDALGVVLDIGPIVEFDT